MQMGLYSPVLSSLPFHYSLPLQHKLVCYYTHTSKLWFAIALQNTSVKFAPCLKGHDQTTVWYRLCWTAACKGRTEYMSTKTVHRVPNQSLVLSLNLHFLKGIKSGTMPFLSGPMNSSSREIYLAAFQQICQQVTSFYIKHLPPGYWLTYLLNTNYTTAFLAHFGILF